jgi:cytochrome c
MNTIRTHLFVAALAALFAFIILPVSTAQAGDEDEPKAEEGKKSDQDGDKPEKPETKRPDSEKPDAGDVKNPCANPCAKPEPGKDEAANPCANPCATPSRMDPALFSQPAGFEVDVSGRNGRVVLATGEHIWSDRTLGTTGLSCQACHRDFGRFNEGFATPYPHKVEAASAKTGVKEFTAAEMVQLCTMGPIGGEAFDWDGKEIVGLTAWVLHLQAGFEAKDAPAQKPDAKAASKRGTRPDKASGKKKPAKREKVRGKGKQTREEEPAKEETKKEEPAKEEANPCANPCAAGKKGK